MVTAVEMIIPGFLYRGVDASSVQLTHSGDSKKVE